LGFVFGSLAFILVAWVGLHIIRWWVFRHPRIRHALKEISGCFTVIAGLGMVVFVVTTLSSSLNPTPWRQFEMNEKGGVWYINGPLFVVGLFVAVSFIFSVFFLVLVSGEGKGTGQFPLRWRLKVLRRLVRFNRPSWKKLERMTKINADGEPHLDK